VRRRRDKAAPPIAQTGWDVRVEVATKQTYTAYTASRKGYGFYDFEYEDRHLAEPVAGKVAVRLTYNGKPSMTFATLGIKDDDFDESILTHKAAAQEKAASLNAAGVVG
jgi:hypothetical protein